MTDGTEYCIVNRSTGEVVQRGFESREKANAARWTNYESGDAHDMDTPPEYGVEEVDDSAPSMAYAYNTRNFDSRGGVAHRLPGDASTGTVEAYCGVEFRAGRVYYGEPTRETDKCGNCNWSSDADGWTNDGDQAGEVE